MKAPFDIAKVLVNLNEEGTKLLPSADLRLDDFGPDGQGMLHCLIQISGTVFGNSIMLPSEEDLSKMTKKEIHEIFNGFVRIS